MSRIVWIVFLVLSACATASLEKNLLRVTVGMDKDQVLNAVGNPRRTFREHGQDHWIYTYFQGEQEINRIVVFDDGKVSKVGRARAKTNWEKDIEGAKNSPDAGFKAIDGSKGEP